MIFQDPLSALHPFYKVGTQLVEAMQAHRGISKSAARARAVELLELVGIPDPKRRVDQYPHEFSGGMRQRAMIAMALSNEPKLLIADEPTTALDVTVQAQILALLQDLQQRLGTAIIIITHDLGVVAEIADDICVMYAGRIVERGTTEEIFHTPAASLHVGPAQLDPAAGQPARRGARADLGPAAEPDQPAQRLPLPSPLPVRARRPQARGSPARARSTGAPSTSSPACSSPRCARRIWDGIRTGRDAESLRRMAAASAEPDYSAVAIRSTDETEGTDLALAERVRRVRAAGRAARSGAAQSLDEVNRR